MKNFIESVLHKAPELTPEQIEQREKLYKIRINARKEAKSGNPRKRAEARRAITMATEMIDRLNRGGV